MSIAAPISMQIVSAGDEAWLGAAAFLAVLAYPGTSEAENRKKDRFVEACRDYLTWFYASGQGMRRVTQQRAQAAENPWIRRRSTLKRHEVERALGGAEQRIRQRRFACAQIAMSLMALDVEHELERKGLRVLGPRSRSAMLTRWAAKIGRAEEDISTMKRHWNETLPVLHLAVAFYANWCERAEGQPDIVVSSFRWPHTWLQATLETAEHYVDDLASACGFDPAARIKITSVF